MLCVLDVLYANTQPPSSFPQLATILENVATKLGAATVATAIGKAEQVLVDGADIIDDLAQAQADWGAKNYAAFGADLGQLAQDVSATGCKSWVCKLAQGILSQFDIYFSDLTKCEADITVAMANFTNGANLWTSKNYGGAVTDFAAGLNIVAKAVTDCGIKQELDSLQVREEERERERWRGGLLFEHLLKCLRRVVGVLQWRGVACVLSRMLWRA